MNHLYFVLAVMACFAGGEVLIKLKVPPEVARKFVHVSACLMLSGHRLFGLDVPDLIPIGAGFALVLLMTRVLELLPSMASVKRDSWGEVFLPLAVLVLSWLHVDSRHFSIAFLILGIADAAASLVGQAVVSRAYVILGSRKTLAGSAAFLASAWLVLNVSIGGAAWPTELPVALGLATIAILLTMAEGLGSKGADNLIVPLASAGLLGSLFSPAAPLGFEVTQSFWIDRVIHDVPFLR